MQSKFRATHTNFRSHNMSAEDLLKMDVKNILEGKKKDERGRPYNDRIRNGLQKDIQKLTNVASYKTHVILLANANRFNASALRKLVEGYDVDQFSHDRIYDVRVALATEFRVNQARSNISQFFEPKALEKLIKLGDIKKYEYGHDVLLRLLAQRRKKPLTAGDRYHTRQFGQALRYGYYAVVAVAINRIFP